MTDVKALFLVTELPKYILGNIVPMNTAIDQTDSSIPESHATKIVNKMKLIVQCYLNNWRALFQNAHENDIFLPRPIHFVNIQFIMLKWSVGSVWTCWTMIVKPPRVRTITPRGSRTRVSGTGGRRSNKERQRLQLLASVARAPLCEVRRVRYILNKEI